MKSYLTRQAIAFLIEFSEFFPFGVATKSNLSIVPVSTYFNEEYPSSADVIKHLELALKESLKLNRFVSVAICSDVLISHPVTNERMDALEIRYQNNKGEKLNIYIPYRKEVKSIQLLDEYEEEGTLNL